MDKKGLITEIQHGSVHDGPGIRTTIFMKGCNMRCHWCHNPETVHPKPEILWIEEKCIQCGRCSDGCFTGAKRLYGKEVTVDEVLEDILSDRMYYGSDGGMTLTGGEPLLQSTFALELLDVCRKHGIGTALETNLSLSFTVIKEAAELCDLIMCDLKFFDETLHKKYTGISNRKIMENITLLSELSLPVIVRTPVIQGLNDNEGEIGKIADFLSNLPNIEYYELLTYHPLGVSKGKSEHFNPVRFEKPEKKTMKTLAETAARKGLKIKIDGVLV